MSGIVVDNYGDGSIGITTTGTITGNGGAGAGGAYGIFASSRGGSVDISAVNVVAEDDGIYAASAVDGGVTINVTGTVTTNNYFSTGVRSSNTSTGDDKGTTN